MMDLRQLVRMRGMLLEAVAVAQEPKPARKRGNYRTRKAAQFAEIAKRYLAGELTKNIQADTGGNIWHALRKMGVEPRRRGQVDDAEIVRRYLAGVPVKRCTDSYGTLYRVLERNGIDARRIKRPASRATAAVLCMLAAPGWAQDCRPLPEILVEAELERGEVLERTLQMPDGSVQALLADPLEGSWTLLRVSEGEDVDQACVEARSEP